MSKKELNPFDFMNAASLSKQDLIGDSENPELTEKQYSPYIVNRGFANFEDTILHANEMNQRAHLFSIIVVLFASVSVFLNGQKLKRATTLMQFNKCINVIVP